MEKPASTSLDSTPAERLTQKTPLQKTIIIAAHAKHGLSPPIKASSTPPKFTSTPITYVLKHTPRLPASSHREIW